MLECVVNISEGQRSDVLDSLARAVGAELLDVHADADHHRSVFTIASTDPSATQDAARRLARAAATLSLERHEGVHPRLGVIDVVPFVALAPTPVSASIDAARSFGDWIASELAVPAFFYDLADDQHRTLPSVRRDAFHARVPDAGPSAPHATLGATAVGARGVLVAVNLELDRGGLAVARAVAHEIRERDGGLVGVRALGLALPSVARTQVSMNLVDLESTGLEAALTSARARVEAKGGHVASVELVGLVPAVALEGASAEFLAWSGIGPDATIERRASAMTDGRGASGGADATPGEDRAPGV